MRMQIVYIRIKSCQVKSIFEIEFHNSRMGVQGVIQQLTKYAGQGAIFGGALYYAVKEYRYPNLQRVDLLKDSYNNLKKTFDGQKVVRAQVYW